MSEICVSIDEAARLLGVHRATIYRRLKNGRLEASVSDVNGRPGVLIPEALLSHDSGHESHDYIRLRREWLNGMASGKVTGKPLSKRTIEGYDYGLKAFWDILGVDPDMKHLTSPNLREAVCMVGTRAYAKRQKVWLGVVGFARFLVSQGALPKEQLLWMMEWKPKRAFPPRREVLSVQQVDRLFLLSGSLGKGGRTAHDKAVNQLLVVLFAYAGLRLSEACALKVTDCNMDEGILEVIEGKGNKSRIVGMVPLLRDTLSAWLESHRPKAPHDYVLVTQDGGRLSHRRIQRRIQVLGRELGLQVSPHALRRSFATIMENAGMPWSYIKKALGHSDIRTTQGYVLTDAYRMVDFMRSFETSDSLGVAVPEVHKELLEEMAGVKNDAIPPA